MTRNNIYTKFMIEYDKATVSSYPSFTKYEIATFLDKAYLTVILQKITGNNIRKAQFTQDPKIAQDLSGLITKDTFDDLTIESNRASFDIPTDFLFFVSGTLNYGGTSENMIFIQPQQSLKYIVTPYNKPIIKNPGCYFTKGTANVFYDPRHDDPTSATVQYIHKPGKFYDDSTNEISAGDFELNDQIAEEVISTAIVYALENIESPRINLKLTVSQLEA